MLSDPGLLRLGQLKADGLRKLAERYGLADAVRQGRECPAAVGTSAITCAVALGAIAIALGR
jgi:hypothetical protein